MVSWLNSVVSPVVHRLGGVFFFLPFHDRLVGRQEILPSSGRSILSQVDRLTFLFLTDCWADEKHGVLAGPSSRPDK